MASNAIIQCSSSSSHPMRTYDVFVSFRGEDTRNNFTSFLCRDLSRNGIEAFKDDTHLPKGESIAPELLQAIEGSRIFIVVFSNNYASSTWCLRELAHICNCIQTSQRPVLPIFYDVDPSEVRKQSGCYEKAFSKHEDKEKTEEVQRWREALTRVSNLSGWDIRNKPQYVVIEEIIQKITNILGHKFSSLSKDNLVGMESRVKKLLKILCLESINDVRVIGVTGMGGIGKTTIAQSLYERISHQYDFCCFIDVSKIYQDSSTIGVQKEILSQCLKEKNLKISNASDGTYLVWTRLRHARALIVLDNVDQDRQLNMFTGNRETLLRECLGGGTRIIIISRDEHILRTHGADDVYQVQPLNDEDAIQLFYKYAFKGNDIMSDYEEMTNDALSHVQGHPLAIQVLGSSLFGRNISQWKSALARLGENKSANVMDVLRLSFDNLDNLDKEIFLDISCFLNEFKEKHVLEILVFRGFHPEYGLRVLVDKSLITIEYGCIFMHNLLIDLGRCIVREKSPKEPRKWSRLWDYQDLHKVMSDNMESENLEVIAIEGCIVKFDETTMRADALSKISKLKFLKLQFMDFCGSLDHLSNELGYLEWKEYPFKSLPPSFQPNNLVKLSLCRSNIKQLWKDRKSLPNLKHLDLSESKSLMKVPDLGEAFNLRLLNLSGCEKLRQLHPSIGLLRKLTFLNLEECTSLIKITELRENLNLERLNLRGCIQLKEFNISIGFMQKLTHLDLSGCKNLVSLPDSILCLNSLEYLNLSGCQKLLNISRNEEQMKKLCIDESPICSHSTNEEHLLHSRVRTGSVSRLLPPSPTLGCMLQLHLSFCNLVEIPDAIGNLHFLEILNLKGNNFSTLPSLKELSKLQLLNLKYCRQLKYLPELPSRTDLSSKRILKHSFNTKKKPWALETFLTYMEAGLITFGCPELIELERCTSMALSWTLQILLEVELNIFMSVLSLNLLR
ncbi:TMV resistance protein N isoform X2 [Cajanus cajan]|uniref:TMV resistance protein N isoform X2 n=1 Tax=Cajanus cajan TaxID=3821 RepID=UPI00098D7D24|nr:TMV resistance protein N isoform X2 [Cajanus cajan]XP_029129186.1 TMV resistance protein N isoform X2 [Cajanus cajan]